MPKGTLIMEGERIYHIEYELNGDTGSLSVPDDSVSLEAVLLVLQDGYALLELYTGKQVRIVPRRNSFADKPPRFEFVVRAG